MTAGGGEAVSPVISEVPAPDVLYLLPSLHEQRPRGSKAMIDAHGCAEPARMLLTGRLVAEPVYGGEMGDVAGRRNWLGSCGRWRRRNALRFDPATTSGPPHRAEEIDQRWRSGNRRKWRSDLVSASRIAIRDRRPVLAGSSAADRDASSRTPAARCRMVSAKRQRAAGVEGRFRSRPY